MAKQQNKVFPKEGEDRAKETIRKLKAELKKVNKKLQRAEDEKKQLMRAFNSNLDHIEEITDELSLEDILRVVRHKKRVHAKVPDRDDSGLTDRRRELIEEMKETYGKNTPEN